MLLYYAVTLTSAQSGHNRQNVYGYRLPAAGKGDDDRLSSHCICLRLGPVTDIPIGIHGNLTSSTNMPC
jgi:hypothetical protein